MADERSFGIDKTVFFNRLREALPNSLRGATDEQLLTSLKQADKRFESVNFEDPEGKVEDPGFFEAFFQSVKQQAFRTPEIIAGTLNTVQEALTDPSIPGEKERMDKRTALYNSARAITEQLIEEDPALREYMEWAANDPFQWSKFINPTGGQFGRVAGQALTSMGAIMGAGLLGGAIAGPKGAIGLGAATAFAMESSEAYSNIREEAMAKGFTAREIDQLSAEGAMAYGLVSAVLETIVPAGVLKSWGFSKHLGKRMAGKYQSIYTAKAVARGGTGGPDLAKESMEDLVAANISITDRIKVLGGAVGIPMLAEGATELSQFLTEEAIREQRIDGTEIDFDWLAQKLASPEAQESFAGGLVGAGFFSGPLGIRKARGTKGRTAAQIVNDFPEGPKRDAVIKATLDSKDLTPIEKAEFMSAVSFANASRAVEDIKQTVEAQKTAADVAKGREEAKKEKAPAKKTTTTRDESTGPKKTKDEFGEPSQSERGKLEDAIGQEPSEIDRGPSRDVNVVKEIIDPEKDFSHETIAGKDSDIQIADFALRFNRRFDEEMGSLTEEEQSTAVGLLAMGLNKVLPKPIIDKDGNFSREDVIEALLTLRQGRLAIGKEFTDKGLEGVEERFTLTKLDKKAPKKKTPTTKVRGDVRDSKKKPAKKQKLTPEQVAFEKFKKRVFAAAEKQLGSKIPRDSALRDEGQESLLVETAERLRAEDKQREAIDKEVRALTSNDRAAQKLKRKLLALPPFERAEEIERLKTVQAAKEKKRAEIQERKKKAKPKAETAREKAIRLAEEHSAKQKKAEAPSEVNINNATVSDFKNVSGVGKKTAEKIIAHVKESGPITDRAGLLAVKGIGPITAQKLMALLPKREPAKVEFKDTSDPKVEEKAKAAVAEKSTGVKSRKTTKRGRSAFQIAVPGTSRVDQAVVAELIERLRRQFPFIDSQFLDEIKSFRTGKPLSGEAILTQTGKAVRAIVNFSKSSARIDTFPHEYAHIYVAMLRSDPLVVRARREFGSEEELVQFIGEYYANRLKGSIFKKVELFIKRMINKFLRFAKQPFEAKILLSEQFFNAQIIEPNQPLSNEAFEQQSDSQVYKAIYGEEDDKDGNNNWEAVLSEIFDDDPGVLIDRHFFAEYGLYLDDQAIAQMVEYARENKHLSFLNDRDLQTAIENLSNIAFTSLGLEPVREYSKKHEKDIKAWWQKANSTSYIDFEGDNPEGRWKEVIYVEPGSRNFKIEPLVYEEVKNDAGEVERVAIHPVTGRPWKNREPQNFLEEDQVEFGVKNKLIYINAKDSLISVQTDKNASEGFRYSFAINDPNFVIDNIFVENLNKQYANNFHNDPEGTPLQFFLGETRGDNGMLVVSAVSQDMIDTFRGKTFQEQWDLFENYLENEVVKETMDDSHVKAALKSFNEAKDSNPYIHLQLIGIHERWKSIKGATYLARGKIKNVADAYKRLKIDLAKGTVPRGIGDSSVMIVNEGEVEFHLGANKLEHMRPDGAGYAYDGMTMTSKKYFDKMNKVMGNNSLVYKTYIRALGVENPNQHGEFEDYIGIKSIEMTPPDGLRVLKKKDDGSLELVAHYTNSTWKDSSGREFDRLVTPNEAKDFAGKYSNLYEVNTLPERATRVLKVSNKHKQVGAFPILGFELFLDNKFIDENPAAKDVLDRILTHYEDLADTYTAKLNLFREDVNAFKEFVSRDMQDGEIPVEIQKIIEMAPEALYMKSYLGLISSMLNNQFIVNGLYKAKQVERGVSTFLTLKPDLGVDVKQGNIAISADDRVMLRRVIEKANIDLKGKKHDFLIREVNEWLANNTFEVLVHRTPIQSYAKVVVRRIQEFVPGNHGKVVFQTPFDVFRVHEADFDGDIVFIEDLDGSPLLDSLKEMHKLEDHEKRDKIVELSWFAKGNLGNNLMDYSQVLNHVKNNQKLKNIQGLVVNAKTMLSVLSYKGIKVEFKSGQVIEPWNPTDRTIMDYFPLDPNLTQAQKDQIKANGDDILTRKDGTMFLITTKENEFSILLQAAVDNAKFGLFDRITPPNKSMFEWLQSRIWKVQGEDINSRISANQRVAAGMVAGKYNLSQIRQGREKGRSKNLAENIATSLEVEGRYFDIDGNRYTSDETSSVILNQLEDEVSGKKRRAILGSIKSIKTNGNLSPMDILISAFGRSVNDLNIEMLEDRNLLFKDFIQLDDVARYKANHRLTMSLIAPEYFKMFQEADIKEVQSGIKFGSEMQQEYVEMYALLEQERAEKSKDFDSNEFFASIDYGQEVADFTSKWYKKYKQLSETEQEWSTIYFLNGGVVDGRPITNVGKMLPAILMNDKVFKIYAEKYRENLYKADSEVPARDKAMNRDLNTLLRKPETFAEKYCG